MKSLGKVDYLKLSLKDAPDANAYSHFNEVCDRVSSIY